jgi:aspartyl-tRNA(Asn)/glutamyl-tRNA(Gln) amidotransferase subunit B
MKEHWEAIIGLEIHLQLNTQSKLFSSAPNHFGDDPNVNISEVCTGLPGSLPVLNEEAVKKAVLFGLSIDADIAPVTSFDRKSYFYPDSPRNFQITQFRQPIIRNGEVPVNMSGEIKHFSISQAHLEDDAGMLKHFNAFAAVDYNRAGVPLIEIVSQPCMHSAKEASSYAKAVRAIFQYLDASDCNMEEGSLRIDVNVSVRKKGETDLRTKIEIKNINSFHYMELAIDAEIERQISLYEEHHSKDPKEVIKPGTYRWDPDAKTTILMRTKERAEDYRYFPEPDIPPFYITPAYLESVRKELPELPHERFDRYTTSLSLSAYNAQILIEDKILSDYFEEALNHTSDAKSLCNWITVEFAGKLKDSGKNLRSIGIAPKSVAQLVECINQGTITGKIAKSIADDMIENPSKNPHQIIQENPDYVPMNDESELEAIIDQILKDNPNSIQDYRAGRTKALAFLVGQVMKQTRGKASPDIVNKILKNKISE